MTVYERVQAWGEWDLKLKAATPKSVRDLIVPFSHVVVLPGHVYANRLSDAAILAGASYTGVVLRLPGRSGTIGGHGLAWWLGDLGGDTGALLEAEVTQTSASLSTWISALRPAALAAGTVTNPGGSLTWTYRWVTAIQAIFSVCQHFTAEWRVNPDFTLDAAQSHVLYGTTPVAITLPVGGGSDNAGGIVGLDAAVDSERDYYDFTTRLIASCPGGLAAAGGAHASYRDGQGNLVTLYRVVDSPDTPAGGESTAATNLLALWSNDHGQRELTVSASRYGITSVLAAGQNLYIYDPEYGLYDVDNLVRHRGRATFPIPVRVFGVRWPIEAGMGVLLRYYDGATLKYLDLTDYVEFESGDAQLEVAPW